MKKYIFSLICVLGFSFAAMAQSSGAEEQSVMNGLQKQKFTQIQKTHQMQMESILGLQENDVKTYYQKAIEIHEATDSKMKAIMNEKQWANYDKLRQERMKMLKMQQRAIK